MQENISKVVKIAIKTAIVIYFISYIAVIFAYNLFQGFDKSKKKEFAIKAFNLVFHNNDIKFDISENNNLVKLENFSISKLGAIENLQVKNLTINLNPINILKLTSPVTLYEVNGINVLLKNTNLHSSISTKTQDQELSEYSIKQAIKEAEGILRITSKIIKNEIKISDITITKSNNQIIALGNVIVENLRTRYFEKTIRISSKANIGDNGNFNLNCDININSATKKIKSISIDSTINNAARDLTKILKNEGIKNIPIIDDIHFNINSEFSNGKISLKSFEIKSQNSYFLLDGKLFKIDNINISGKSNKNDIINLNPIVIKSKAINISSDPSSFKISSLPELKLKFKINSFKANDIISFFWPEKILQGTKKFLLSNNISNNKNATCDLSILKNYDLTAKFNVEDANNQSFEKFFPGVNAKNSEIIVTKDRLKVYVEKADSLKKDITAEKINIYVDYKDTNAVTLSIMAKNASSDYKLLLQEMYQVNTKLYSFLPSISNILLGHNINNSATRVLVSDFVLKIPFYQMDNIFKNTQISLKANVPISNIQFIKTNIGNYGICKLEKTKNSSSIQTNCKIQNPVKLDILNDQPSIYKVSNIVNIGKSTLIQVNLFDQIGEIAAAVNLTSSANEEILKIDSTSGQSKISLFASIPNNNCEKPLVVNLTGEDLNLERILENKITFNSHENQKKCHFWDNLNLYVDLKNIAAKHEKTIDKIYAKIDIKNSKINDINIDISNQDHRSCFGVVKKEDGIFHINGFKFSKILNGLFNEPDLLYSRTIQGNLKENGDNISTDLKLEDIKFKIAGEKDQKSSDISKSIIPGASVFSNYISYDNVGIDFIVNKNANTVHLTNFIATKTNAKLTASGDYDFGNDKMNISGKVDSAYMINRLITFDKIPALNKMITLGNKDGGYGVVNYKISGKMSELSKKSIEISGDRSSAVIAGGLFFINPLLSIPLLLNANDAKNEILDNKKT